MINVLGKSQRLWSEVDSEDHTTPSQSQRTDNSRKAVSWKTFAPFSKAFAKSYSAEGWWGGVAGGRRESEGNPYHA